MRVSEETLMDLLARTGKGQSGTTQPVTPKSSKYRNVKTAIDGIVFDSKAEAARYAELKLRFTVGEIRELRVHPVFTIAVNGKQVCNYEADFAYIEGGNDVVEDVKGVRTAVYSLKKKLLDAVLGIKIKEVKRRP